jgi:hypothetical protein
MARGVMARGVMARGVMARLQCAPGAEPGGGSSQTVPLGERPAARLDKQLGYKCYACSSYLRDPQLNRSRMAAHLYGSCKATYEVRVAAWNSKPLNENKPHPMGCPLVFGSPSSPSTTGSFTPSLPRRRASPAKEQRQENNDPGLLQVGRREVSLCIFMLPARK